MKFELNKTEINAFNKFQKMCIKKDNPYTGAVGGRFSVEFGITSIGFTIIIKDSVTKIEKNITDYDMW